MKILAFADMHGSMKALRKIRQEVKKKKVELLVCAGDISIFEQNLKLLYGKLNDIGIPVLMIHGNHESEVIMKRLAKEFKNIKFFHKGSYYDEDILFFGYGGGGFSLTDTTFRKIAKKFEKEIKKKNPKKVVLVTHAPPHGTKLDMIIDEHCGNKDIRAFIKKVDLTLVISGHIHETAGTDYKLKKTRLINPGPFGKVISL